MLKTYLNESNIEGTISISVKLLSPKIEVISNGGVSFNSVVCPGGCSPVKDYCR